MGRRPIRPRQPRNYRPPRWAIVTVALAGLTYMVWHGWQYATTAADLLGMLLGLVCVGGIAVLVLWGIFEGARAYVRHYRVAIPATAGCALVGTVLWQIFDSLGPGGKLVMVLVVLCLAFVVGLIMQS